MTDTTLNLVRKVVHEVETHFAMTGTSLDPRCRCRSCGAAFAERHDEDADRCFGKICGHLAAESPGRSL